jgi:hypothetical protein
MQGQDATNEWEHVLCTMRDIDAISRTFYFIYFIIINNWRIFGIIVFGKYMYKKNERKYSI